MKVEFLRLSEVAEVNPRRGALVVDDDLPVSFVPMEAVDDVLGRITAATEKTFSEVKKGYTAFVDHDVIFAKVSPCMQNGKHAVATGLRNGLGFGSTEFHVVRPGSRLLPAWIHHFLRTQDTLDAAKKTFNGAVGLQRVPPAFLENLVLPVPGIDDQKQVIANLEAQLAAVEDARQAATAQLRELTQLANAIIRETLTHPDTETHTLGDVLVRIEAGKSFQTSDQPAKPNELGVLKVSAVSWSAFRAEEAKAVSNYQPEPHHRVGARDLLISRANTRELVGAVVLVGHDHPHRLLSDKTLRLVIDELHADKIFLLYALRTEAARRHIEHFATGTSDSMRNISQEVISSIPIPLPDLPIQRRIGQAL